MTMLRGFLVIAFSCVLALLTAQFAAAKTQTVSGGSVTVSAKILPTHYILVDSQGIIQQIDSNTKGEATPRVFLQKVAAANAQPMTDDILAQYERILPTGKSQVGTVYIRGQLPSFLLFTPKASPSGILGLQF